MKKVYELVDMTKAGSEETVETICIKVSLRSFGGYCSHSWGGSAGVVFQQAESSRRLSEIEVSLLQINVFMDCFFLRMLSFITSAVAPVKA